MAVAVARVELHVLDAGSYVHDDLAYVKPKVELVQAVGVEGSVQDAQVVVDEEVEVGSDQDAQVVVVSDAGSVDVAEPQL